MSARQLSPELVSLVHHVELNESGWWKKAVGQVVKGVLWKAQSPLTVAELHEALRKELGLRLADDVLSRQLDSLSSQGAVVRMPGPNYKLTERTFQELSAARSAAVAEQDACRDAFFASCAENCPELDASKAWQAFTKALAAAIHVTGANLYHLLADGNLQREVDWLADFISKFEPEHREGLRKVLTEFFAPGNHVCRNQVLRFLTAHFFAEAAQLRPETLDVIDSDRKTRTIKVVLDTNFIFSVLQLHDNPADEAALSLIDLAQKSQGKLEIKLYVLPSTLDEAQRVLLNQMHQVESIRTTRAMARAALSQPLSSIARRFFDAAARSPGLTATAFFQPYIDDLRTILRGKGIAVLEAHPAVYHQRQDVVDDVLDEQRREEAELPAEKRKGYETLLHDAVLWHAVNDRRSQDADSPFEVEYWAVSIDWRLIAFDRAKRYANRSKLPVVLHPTNLVQLIQFWVPRTPELEESLVDALRLPLFFQSFDPEDERATVKVLESISRIENVGDLPEPTLRVVLANRALRARLRDADASNDQAFELVREELLSVHKTVLSELETTRSDLKSREELLSAERQGRTAADAAHAEATKRAEEAEAKATEAERRAEDLETARQQLEQRRAGDVEKAEAKATQEAQRAEAAERSLTRQRYAALFYVLPAVLGASAVGAASSTQFAAAFPALAGGWKHWAVLATAFLLPVCTSFMASPMYVTRRRHLQDWWPAKFAHFVRRKLLVAPAAAGAGAIYQGGVWDGVKALLGIGS